MRSPFRSFTSFITSIVLSLLAIITILLGYKFLSAEYAKYETLEWEQSVLHKFKGQLESVRDTVAQDLPSRIPQLGTPLNLLADRIKELDSEIRNKQATRRKLWDDHPIERYLPINNIFLEIASIDIEISFLQQGLSYVHNLHSFAAGPAEAERQLKWFQAGRDKLSDQIYQNKKAQWDLSKRAPLMWQVPLTPAYREMKRLEEEERLLKSSLDQHDAEIARHQGILQKFQNLPRPGPLVLDHRGADRIIQPVSERLSENDKKLEGSTFRKFMRPVKEVLPTALWILVLTLFAPLLVKAISYYLIAPVAARRPPLRLLPESSGKVFTSTGFAGSESAPTMPSRVSLPLILDERSELLILPSYLQGMPLNAKSDTQWLLDWSMPLSSVLAGMYRLTRVRPNSEESITVSSSTDPLAEFSMLDVAAGSALVLQPRCLVGIMQPRGEQLKITRHWRFRSLGAWLTLQFRYIVFHGPAKLIVKGCRGVRVEPATSGRTVNQAATLGFTANLDYSVARNETFWSYYFGERELFNDSWRGDGCFVHAETPNPSDRSGLFGRGLQGIVDTFLKIVGI
ncbi:MAG: hypothetical protein J0M13_14665 [Candidatus Accumulibacter sp.]|nr:hypothetical protein [Candidatus Accumulibacter necessarius]